MFRKPLPFVALLAGILVPSAALPCSLAPLAEHEIDEEEQQLDDTAPERVKDVDYTIKRGTGPSGTPLYASSTSCDDLGFLTLRLKPGGDDRTGDEDLGYRLKKADGDFPDGFSLPKNAVRASKDSIALSWIDGATDDQESFAFDLEVFAVDLAGNESEPYLVVIEDAPTGCSSLRAEPSLAGLAFLLLGMGRTRRRAGGRLSGIPRSRAQAA